MLGICIMDFCLYEQDGTRIMFSVNFKQTQLIKLNAYFYHGKCIIGTVCFF